MVNWTSVGHEWVSLGGSLAAELELMIARGELPTGEKIPPERELATMLGVSRATLREALLELEIRGLLSRRPGRGTVVQATTPDRHAARLSEALRAARADFAQVMELRSTVEPAVAALAAGKTTPEDIVRLQALLEAADGENNATRLLELDVEFHVAIADIARNPLVSDLIRMVSDWASSSRRLGFQGPSRTKASAAGHAKILAALRSGDSAKAAAAMREHLGCIEDTISDAT
ncbi:FadR/GntR family transcriptional regulator [Arthrobacter halodurans]|uniref:FadR/GntR family transcriptional regulator n=1 Tax=Arthrobacter halodurans TaxID=516699 RepID=A0ABV4USN0_9MICC